MAKKAKRTVTAKSKAAYIKKIHTGYAKLHSLLRKHDPAFVRQVNKHDRENPIK
jgi:hypothetical protein